MKIFLAFLSLVFALLADQVIENKSRFHYDWANAFWRTVLDLDEGTVWAPGFSEDAFSAVKIGMKKSEVASLLGKPLQDYCDRDYCSWSYSSQERDNSDYDRRWIFFEREKVSNIRREFYID